MLNILSSKCMCSVDHMHVLNAEHSLEKAPDSTVFCHFKQKITWALLTNMTNPVWDLPATLFAMWCEASANAAVVTGLLRGAGMRKGDFSSASRQFSKNAFLSVVKSVQSTSGKPQSKHNDDFGCFFRKAKTCDVMKRRETGFTLTMQQTHAAWK